MRASKSLLLQKGGDTLFGDTTQIMTETNLENTFGVKTMIGEFETSNNTYRSVFPIQILPESEKAVQEETPEEVIAGVLILFSDSALLEKINRWIIPYNAYLIGRMEIPYRAEGVYMIYLTFDSPVEQIDRLTHRLMSLSGVQIKTLLSPKKKNRMGDNPKIIDYTGRRNSTYSKPP